MITLSRAIAALLFVCIALVPKYGTLATIFYLYACISDVLDGFLARRLLCVTKTGSILDLFSDKYLTIISMIYAIERDLPILPCLIAILREVFLLSMRNIHIDGSPLFPPQRVVGTLTVAPIWIGTLLLLQAPHYVEIPMIIFGYWYWGIGLIALINLASRIHKNWNKIIQSFND